MPKPKSNYQQYIDACDAQLGSAPTLTLDRDVALAIYQLVAGRLRASSRGGRNGAPRLRELSNDPKKVARRLKMREYRQQKG